MSKQEFLDALKEKLSGLSEQDKEERTGFYSEMIDDRIEEGLSEEEAVASVGNIDEIAFEISSDKEKNKKTKTKRKLKTWEIVLLAVGSPIWASLLIIAVSVVISLYASMLAVAVSVWAAFGALAGASVFGIGWGAITICTGEIFGGVAFIGTAIACAGLSLFAFLGSKEFTKLSIGIPKKIVLVAKGICNKKEEVK